jgi:hypothetical protein
MDQTVPFSNVFRMKPLPKAEYRLMKAMIERYNLDGPHELFTCLLRLAYETIYSEKGEEYLKKNIIAVYRDNKLEQRTYQLP